ncbi:MAG: major capsid protein [Magnetococcales bacterium]|nr:major capsid protein [Magnetococcales bacterium]
MEKMFKKVAAGVVGLGSVIGISGLAHADLLTDSQTAITDAAADATTVGGYVVAAICTMIVIGLVIKMVRKL